MGSWCTSFPTKEWSEDEFHSFVSYFETIRESTFGGNLDGIDWDWEGFCSETCLKDKCSCGWDDKVCGAATPAELAAGLKFEIPDTSPGPEKTITMECYTMPTKETVQVMTGITYYMKQAGHVVMAPMSTAVYSGEPDTSAKQNMRNEFVKWRKQTVGGKEVDLLEMADGILLQWYSGFDASLCQLSDDPKACTCDNVQLEDYPNIYNNTKDPNVAGVYYQYLYTDHAGLNLYPQTQPVRCQACGPNTIMPNGTRVDLKCYKDGDDWYMPGDIVKYPQLITEH